MAIEARVIGDGGIDLRLLFITAQGFPAARFPADSRIDSHSRTIGTDWSLAGPVLDLLDPAGHTWRIHVFIAQVQRGELALNWEHDAACWVSWPSAVATLALVPWLTDLVDAVTIPSTAIAA